jgi:hypothetical protein
MSIMSLARIKYLRECLEEEYIDLTEIAEIEEAFAQFPDDQLRDLRENATAEDMLDELETLVSPLERDLHTWVGEHFGDSEEREPSYDLGAMANFIESKFEVKEK